MPLAVCWFWGNLQLEETGLHISSFGVWMMAFSMVLWSQFYTWVMAALNYSHNIMGKRINPSLPSFISRAFGKWGGGHLPERNKMMLGEVSGSEEAAGSRLCWKCSQTLTRHYTNLSSPDARGRTKEDKWGRWDPGEPSYTLLVPLSSLMVTAQTLLYEDSRILSSQSKVLAF